MITATLTSGSPPAGGRLAFELKGHTERPDASGIPGDHEIADRVSAPDGDLLVDPSAVDKGIGLSMRMICSHN